MLPQLLQRYRFPRRLAFTVLPVILTLGLCGCQTAGAPDVTGSLSDKAESNVADARRDVELYRDRFRANPKDADAAGAPELSLNLLHNFRYLAFDPYSRPYTPTGQTTRGILNPRGNVS